MKCNCCCNDDDSEPIIYVTPETRIIIKEYLENIRSYKENKKKKSLEIEETITEGVSGK